MRGLYCTTQWRESIDRCERILVKYPLFKTAIARIQACFDSHDATAEPDCCPLVGESGSGKTTIYLLLCQPPSARRPQVGCRSSGARRKSASAANCEELCGNPAVPTR